MIARPINFLSIVFVSGATITILEAGACTVATMMAALPRITLLGASGSSAAIATAANTRTTNAVQNADCMVGVDLRAPGVTLLGRGLILGATIADSLP